MRKAYLAGGRLRGSDMRDLPIPQNYGVSTLADLIGWYSDAVTESPQPAADRA
jgi:hypothetical protein